MLELRFDDYSRQWWYGIGEDEYILEYYLWLGEETLPKWDNDETLHVEKWMKLCLMRSSK